jgi:hypothetical protein
MPADWWQRLVEWFRVQRTRRELASDVPPLDTTEPEDVTLDALVDSLQATGAASLGAAVCVTDGDESVWLWASSEDDLLALRAACWKGWRPSALLAAWPSPENQAQVRLYALMDLKTFRNLVAALRAA